MADGRVARWLWLEEAQEVWTELRRACAHALDSPSDVLFRCDDDSDSP